jgi:hypothetical protein
MKKFSILCFISISFSESQVGRQNSTELNGIIGVNEIIDFHGIEVKFKKVIRYSRCPKSVMCIRAGEADILVSIYKNGKFIKDQEISIPASGRVIVENTIFENGITKISGLALSPYLETPDKIPQGDYRLELKSETISKE